MGQRLNIECSDKIVKAIKLLETTNAGLTPDEMEYAKQNIKDFGTYKFKEAIDRNEGLIAISEKGITTTERWEEGRVTINLDTKEIDFKVLWEYEKDDFISDYSKEEYNKIQIHDICFNDIPFDEFSKFKSRVNDLIKNKIYNIKLKDSDKIIGFIE